METDLVSGERISQGAPLPNGVTRVCVLRQHAERDDLPSFYFLLTQRAGGGSGGGGGGREGGERGKLALVAQGQSVPSLCGVAHPPDARRGQRIAAIRQE